MITPLQSKVSYCWLAPGHVLHASGLIQDATATSVQKTRKLLTHGVLHTRYDFADFNQGSRFTTSTTPEIYLSYFDPKVLPNPLHQLSELKLPIPWIDGSEDQAALNIGYENIYNLYVKKDGINQYIGVPGGHTGMCDYSDKPLLSWLAKF